VGVQETTNLRNLLDKFANSGQACFPVVDGDGKLTGVVDGKALRHTISEAGFLAQLLIAKDLVEKPLTLTPKDDLYSAMSKMVSSQQDELLVVDADDALRVIDSLSRSDLIAAYDRQFFS
jgi:CIC family chloride channel protein